MTNWNDNVGTQGQPVSRLHEYAVGLLYDRIEMAISHPNDGGEQYVIAPTMSGEMSGNLVADAVSVSIPDVLTAIGGFVPDIGIYGDNHRPIRVIEVVSTSHPTEKKRDFFAAHGIEIVEVPCRDEADLHALARPIARLAPGENRRSADPPGGKLSNWRPWAYVGGRTHDRANRPVGRGAQQQADGELRRLIEALMIASPHVRREFHRVLTEELGSIDSLLPLSRHNPKRTVLGIDTESA